MVTFRLPKRLTKEIVSILILLFIGNLIGFIMAPSRLGDPRVWLSNSAFSIIFGYPMMQLSSFLMRKFGNRITWDVSPVKRIAVTLGVVIIVAIIVTLLLNYVFIIRINGGSGGEFFKTTLSLLVLQILIVIYVFSLFTALEFFKMWKEGLIKQETLQRKALEMQLETLKNQVNPHFLFNSLNTLTTLVHKDPDMAEKLIINLSDSYRYILEQRDKKLVSLAVETEFVDNYLALQQTRFGGNLIVKKELPASDDLFVIPLSVQMLVENAIKHNVITSDSPLTLELFVEGDFLVVRNNLQVKTTVVSGKVGLENIRQQYALISGKEPEIVRSASHFTVKIPLIKNQNPAV
ncbi:MAG TPA: histidine kinase [Bacteroidales bacterium]|nr:histidine kinase [Bacteroidales bacterium]